MKNFWGTLTLLFFCLFVKAQTIQNFKELFGKVHVSSKGEMLTIHYYFNYRDEMKVEFLKINSAGEIILRKETTEVLPFYSASYVTAKDEIVIYTNSPGAYKKFNFDGELLETVYTQNGGLFIIDSLNQFIVSRQGLHDSNFIKLNKNGEVIWDNFIADTKNMTAPLEIQDGYIIGVHRINAQETNPIEFITYSSNGEVVNKKQYTINEDLVALHKSPNGFIATTWNGRLISLNMDLDTLWSKEMTSMIEGSQSNENGIYFYQLQEGAGIAGSGVTKVDFNGNVIWQYERPEDLGSFVRNVTVTNDDQVIMSCSTHVNNFRTILIKPQLNVILSNTEKLSQTIKLYPNPVSESNSIHITSEFANGALMIFDQRGNKVREVLIDNQDVDVEHSLSKGLYFYQIYQNNAIQTSGKIIVN
ncbi:MAG: T9SS type A sorting domain-containing protein [Sporocytophaga sp.]|uniref:T9SS type A sorting domain-containing protein n=1 Tax=Sporocytophaga sp. TaxID=2231183 RepID=UPI001B1CEE0B|nr:T9SS type A sorting domain-containing protein [Sporocytophaga sp.]MBO9699483.1 T9SS type A sorting domain-containing protein [Sporocytophaga sp.]